MCARSEVLERGIRRVHHIYLLSSLHHYRARCGLLLILYPGYTQESSFRTKLTCETSRRWFASFLALLLHAGWTRSTMRRKLQSSSTGHVLLFDRTFLHENTTQHPRSHLVHLFGNPPPPMSLFSCLARFLLIAFPFSGRTPVMMDTASQGRRR